MIEPKESSSLLQWSLVRSIIRHSRYTCSQVRPANTAEGRPSNANKDVGTIVLKIKLIKRTAPDHPANGPLKPPKPTRIKRSGSEACVSYGVKRTSSVQHDKTWSFVPYDKSTPGAHVQFVFRYRTQGKFRALASIRRVSDHFLYTDFLLDQGIVSPDDLIEPIVDSVAPDLTTDDEHSPRSVHGTLQPQQQTPPSSPHGTISPAVLMKPVPSRVSIASIYHSSIHLFPARMYPSPVFPTSPLPLPHVRTVLTL